VKRTEFDLRHEPWIECETKDGRRMELGLEELFIQAHNLHRFHNDNPLAEAGMFRIFLALAHRIVEGPQDRRTWLELYEKGRFEAEQVHGYFERWSDRFDLFHPDYPFLQVPGLQYLDPKSNQPLPPITIAELLSHRSSGNNSTLIDHTQDSDRLALAPSEAVSALIEHYFFKPGGLLKKNSNYCGTQGSCRHAAMVNGLSVFLESVDQEKGSLFETLLLNLFYLRFLGSFPSWGTPVWEKDPTQSIDCAERSYIPRGYLDYLTLRGRNILLIPDPEGTVSSVYTCCGAWLDEKILHPFTPYRIDSQPPKALNLSTDRALWRDADTLFHHTAAEGFSLRPLRYAHTLPLKRSPALLVYGIINNQMKVLDGVRERLPIPRRILQNPDDAGYIENMIRYAESRARRLVLAVDTFTTTLDHRERSSPKTEDRHAAIREAKTVFFTAMKLPFYRYIEEFDTGDPDAWLRQWQEEVYRSALLAYRDTCFHFGRHKETWHLAYVQGERQLTKKGSV